MRKTTIEGEIESLKQRAQPSMGVFAGRRGREKELEHCLVPVVTVLVVAETVRRLNPRRPSLAGLPAGRCTLVAGTGSAVAADLP